MPIVSSETIYTRPQADGTTRVRVQKTDALGRVYRASFRAVDAVDLARQWSPNLVGSDLVDLESHIESGGTPEDFDLTNRDATRNDVRDRAVRVLKDGETVEASRLSAWFDSLPIGEKRTIGTRLNLTTAEQTAIDTRAASLATVRTVVDNDSPVR